MLTSKNNNGELQIRLTKKERENQDLARIKQGRDPVNVTNWETLVESVIGGLEKEDMIEFKKMLDITIEDRKNTNG